MLKIQILLYYFITTENFINRKAEKWKHKNVKIKRAAAKSFFSLVELFPCDFWLSPKTILKKSAEISSESNSPSRFKWWIAFAAYSNCNYKPCIYRRQLICILALVGDVICVIRGYKRKKAKENIELYEVNVNAASTLPGGNKMCKW